MYHRKPNSLHGRLGVRNVENHWDAGSYRWIFSRLKCYSPAGLIRGGSWWQGLHREELLAALYGVDAGTGQSEGRCRPSDAHPHWHDQGLGHIAELFHCVRQQSLENTPALPDGLRDEVTEGKTKRECENEQCDYSSIKKKSQYIFLSL